MLERQEIDALLISSLYGELTPTEETRLASHLEANPSDKLALAALSSTREAVRESRILQVQLDPPQQISALLLQEAARRAPKSAESEGWFARLARSFMAHPAMAAAAMLVVVLGVTTLVKNRKGDQFAESSAPVASQAVGSGSNSTIDQGALAPTTSATPPEAKTEPKLGDQLRGQAAAGSDSFSVDLDEGDATTKGGKAAEERADKDANKQLATEDSKAAVRREVAKPDVADRAISSDDATGTAKNAKKAAPATKSPSGSYLELRSPEHAPKDFENAPADGRGYNYEDDLAKEQPQTNAITPGPRQGAGNGTAGPSTGSTATVKAPPKSDPKPPEAQVAQQPTTPRTTTTTPGGVAPRNPTPSRNAPVAASPPPPPAKVATTTGTKREAEKAPSEDKAANDPQLAWAREQHVAITAKVRAGDCKTAANIAVGLANRDPSYYQQNVATDRTVRDCLAYIDNAREKDAE
ncbi:hypothetical protein BH11MYX3_BH11MYX3_26920 [soil metagenome]